jgi:hypothetical protein
VDRRCSATAKLPSGQWKWCIRAVDHTEPRHLWLESFAVVGRPPILVVWAGPHNSEPMIVELTSVPHIIEPGW